MLADSIRKYRKENHMSQDELAERLGVSRQSVSLWENGQTQPTIDNIIALAKIFHISSDVLLGVSDGTDALPASTPKAGKKHRIFPVILAAIVLAAVLGTVLYICARKEASGANSGTPGSAVSQPGSVPGQTTPSTESAAPSAGVSEPPNPSANGSETAKPSANASESAKPSANVSETVKPSANVSESAKPSAGISEATEPSSSGSEAAKPSASGSETAKPSAPSPTQSTEPFDLFSYCRDFAIEKGILNGDHCMYQQPSALYGGYENEYFSISFWNDSNRVEFCLHCPLSETYSINFYLRMRGGYNHKYEYVSSKYFRDTGESLRFASGYIDPAVFSANYPISCDTYIGSSDGQNEFMEESRVGICDLIACLKGFAQVENLSCGFSAFEFANF